MSLWNRILFVVRQRELSLIVNKEVRNWKVSES